MKILLLTILLAQMGMHSPPIPMTPEQFGQYIQDDIGRWTKLARDRKIELTD